MTPAQHLRQVWPPCAVAFFAVSCGGDKEWTESIMATQADTTDNTSRLRVKMTAFQGRQSAVPCNQFVSVESRRGVSCADDGMAMPVDIHQQCPSS
mgnify:CR=1